MLELMSCISNLLDHAPLSSSRCGKSLRVVTYGRALRASDELMAKPGPDEFALHLLRRRSNHARGRRRHVGTSDSERRDVERIYEVERVQSIYA